ncbi:MAG: hypothetical protein PW791_09630 [Neorhizobium sp.]|nr:hypothetical protein [Neorhizobium sp.]
MRAKPATLRFHALLIAPLVLVPAVASARDVAGCAALYRELNNLPELIGNTAQMRANAQDMARANAAIRQLRIEMRRDGCGGGSIVHLGAPRGGDTAYDAGSGDEPGPQDCQAMQQSLDMQEKARETLVSERSGASLIRQDPQRGPIMAAIRQNGCIPTDLEEDRKERMKIQGIALPKDDPSSPSITAIATQPALKPQVPAVRPPPPPDRPWDPNIKVRTVGPVFYPDESIDLAHPKSEGPQPQQ